MINEDINKKIMAMDFQGKTKEEIKPLYIQRNAYGVDINSMVYRIFQSQFFLEDVTNNIISLVNINPLVFDEPLENPLLGKEFIEENGETTTLGFLENYYGLSWTEEAKDESWRWEYFTHDNHGVRVKVDLQKLLKEINNIKDKYFMLHYFVGKVTYHKRSEIKEYFLNGHYSQFLDSLGQRAALSLMALSHDYEDEKEIRLLYSYDQYPENDSFVKNEVVITGDNICKHPFNWSGVVKEVLIDSRMTEEDFNSYKVALEKSGITCEIKRSNI